MRDKRGAGHFEMIISFVFFVGVVFFLFVVLRPETGTRISGAVVSGLYDSFEEKVYTNLSEVFLKVEYTGGGNCFYVELPGRIFVYALGGSYMMDLGGVDVDSGLEYDGGDGGLSFDSHENFFRVAISPEFSDEDVHGCRKLKDDEFELGSINERRVISYSALESMASEYYVDYEGLKSDLMVPDVLDFAIVPETLTAVKMEPQRGVPDSGEVVVKDYVLEVLYANGTVINERFGLKVW